MAAESNVIDSAGLAGLAIQQASDASAKGVCGGVLDLKASRITVVDLQAARIFQRTLE